MTIIGSVLIVVLGSLFAQKQFILMVKGEATNQDLEQLKTNLELLREQQSTFKKELDSLSVKTAFPRR